MQRLSVAFSAPWRGARHRSRGSPRRRSAAPRRRRCPLHAEAAILLWGTPGILVHTRDIGGQVCSAGAGTAPCRFYARLAVGRRASPSSPASALLGICRCRQVSVAESRKRDDRDVLGQRRHALWPLVPPALVADDARGACDEEAAANEGADDCPCNDTLAWAGGARCRGIRAAAAADRRRLRPRG